MIEDAWNVGYSYGLDGWDWPAVVATLRAATGRFLTAAGRTELAGGWRAGHQERAEDAHHGWEEAGADAWDGLPW